MHLPLSTRSFFLRKAMLLGWKNVVTWLLVLVATGVWAAPRGKVAWTSPSVASTFDQYSSMTLGPDGRIYITGANLTNESQFEEANILATCLSANGTMQWRKTFDGKAQKYDWGGGIVVGADNNVYVVGDSVGTGGLPHDLNSARDAVLLRYSSEGALLWSRIINGAADGFDSASLVRSGKDGRIYLAGQTSESRSGGLPFSGFLSCYTTNGELVWNQVNRVTNSLNVQPLYMKEADNGDWILLSYVDLGNSKTYALLSRYSSQGTLIWHKPLGNGTRYNPPAGLAVTAQGAVIAATMLLSPGPGTIYSITPNGGTEWSQTFDGIVGSLTTDSKGRIIVAGTGTNAAGLSKTWKVSQYSREGAVLWTNELTPDENTMIHAAQTDPADSIHVTGTWFYLPGVVPRLHTVVYSSAGSILWTNQLSVESRPRALQTDGVGNTYVAAGVMQDNSLKATLIKYSPLLYVAPQTSETAFPLGEKAQLQFRVVGENPIGYQWYFEGKPLEGATSSTLVLTNLQRSDEGDYTLVASNRFLVLTSSVARLHVVLTPTLFMEQDAITIPCGGSGQVAVRADSSEPLSYQWRRNGVSIPGAVEAQYRFLAPDLTSEGNYDVKVSYYSGRRSVTSSVVRVVVDSKYPPVIHHSPVSGWIQSGSRTNLAVVETSCSPSTYQWSRNGVDLPGATQSTLSLPPFNANLAGDYAVRVCNEFGCTTSMTARVELNRPPITEKTGITTPRGAAVTIPDSLLLSQAYDPDRDALSIRSVADHSYWGAPVSRTGAETRYGPLPGFFGLDSIGYTISDGRGGNAPGTLEVFVVEGSLPTYNSLRIDALPGGIRIRYWGPGGAQGMLESSDRLGENGWRKVLDFNVPTHGVWEYHTPAGALASFWRISIQ